MVVIFPSNSFRIGLRTQYDAMKFFHFMREFSNHIFSYNPPRIQVPNTKSLDLERKTYLIDLNDVSKIRNRHYLISWYYIKFSKLRKKLVYNVEFTSLYSKFYENTGGSV